MAAPGHDKATWRGGSVGKANGYQRPHSSTTDLFPESLPAPVAAHHSHITTTGEAQRQRILEMLRTGQKTTLDFRRAGVMQSQTRVFELRAKGYDIPTVSRVTVFDDQGFPHCGVALYELVREPAPEVAP